MLQQTRVSSVVSYYNRWMKKWPTVASLSLASNDEVNKMWSGLGYYSRGKRLLEGAQKIMKNFGGVIPEDSSVLMKDISGIGRYTAAAIASIAFNENVGVLDGNVIRVLCRLKAIGGNTSSKEVNSYLWSLSNALVDHKYPGDFNQGMMELGALVCTPRKPQCASCPLKSCCRAFAKVEAYNNNSQQKLFSTNHRCCSDTCDASDFDKSDSHILPESNRNEKIDDIENCADVFALPHWNPALGVENYPQKFGKKAPRTETKTVLIIQLLDTRQQYSASDAWLKNQSKILMTKRPNSGLLANLWEFPTENNEQLKKGKKRVLVDSSSSIIKVHPSSSNFHQGNVSKFLTSILNFVELNSYEVLQWSFVGEYMHKFSHIHQSNHVYRYKIVTSVKLSDVTVPDSIDCRWVSYVEFGKLAKPTLTINIYKLFTNSVKAIPCEVSDKEKEAAKTNQASIKSFFKKKCQ